MRTDNLAPALVTLYTQINRRWPGRKTASDGSIGDAAHSQTNSNHNPKRIPGHAGLWVTAMDITHDPSTGVNIDTLTDELAASRDPRINELIANRYILNILTWKWVPYRGQNPHTSHLHISVPLNARAFSTAPWLLPSLGDAVSLTPDQHRWLERIHYESTLRLPSRAIGDTRSDTVLGHAINAASSGYRIEAKVQRLEEKVDMILRTLQERP